MLVAEWFPFRLILEHPVVVFRFLELAARRFVQDKRAFGIQLQRSGGNHARERPFNSFCDNRRLFFAGSQKDAATAIQNGADPHRDGPIRHQVGPRGLVERSGRASPAKESTPACASETQTAVH